MNSRLARCMMAQGMLLPAFTSPRPWTSSPSSCQSAVVIFHDTMATCAMALRSKRHSTLTWQTWSPTLVRLRITSRLRRSTRSLVRWSRSSQGATDRRRRRSGRASPKAWYGTKNSGNSTDNINRPPTASLLRFTTTCSPSTAPTLTVCFATGRDSRKVWAPTHASRRQRSSPGSSRCSETSASTVIPPSRAETSECCHTLEFL